ncbi:hypothetical protein BS47DRAFT_1415823 [Hydnum rufescens UP504]|uniref:Uncharacterized protein n=1 Tax=Hydnum rufescens UP504 TaxID=1448309 RepID=A0A9P6APL5_9AGAM|nr:hypothetical protein BS47DRAFT_1415823 [Hydnum rufescens UP504]
MDWFNHNIMPFWVPLYITGGPYDILVREPAQKAKDSAALGDASVRYSHPSRKCHMEAIGSMESQEWFIQWDSSCSALTLFLKPNELERWIICISSTLLWDHHIKFVAPPNCKPAHSRQLGLGKFLDIFLNLPDRVVGTVTAGGGWHLLHHCFSQTQDQDIAHSLYNSITLSLSPSHHTLGLRLEVLPNITLKHYFQAWGVLELFLQQPSQKICEGCFCNAPSHHILKITTNVTSQEPSYPQINIGRCKVADEANNEVNDKTANMEKSGLPGGNWRNKKFCVITSTPLQPPKNQVYIQLESHPKIPEVEYQHESQRSASLLNGTPTSSQVDYPDDPPLLPIQSSEPKHASSTFGYNEEPTVLLSGSHVGLSSVMDISSDDGGIPEACPGDLLYVWDATQVDTLLWSLPDQGADPSEDCINVSHLAKEMRWGPCGALGIIKGLAFFANTRSLKLEQFEIKILKLVKDLQKSRKQLRVPFKVPYGKGKGVEAISEDEVESRDADLGSDIKVGVSNIDDTQLSSDGEGQPHQPQYNRVCPGGLQLEYAKEKEQFNGDTDGLEAWLDDLQSLTQQSKVDKDVQVTSGTKLAKYIHQKKKLLMGEIQHMATFDAHVVAFVVCSRPDAYAAHVQNAILFGSSEIQQLAEKQFNLKKSLEELFVELMNEQLDATGISKWHEEAEKYLRNLFISNGHAWFPVSVPWVQLLALLCWHHIRFIGWLLEEECPAPHPSHTNKSWEGGQWRFLVSEFQKGNSCPIKLERWGEDDADDDTAVPLVIDRDGNAIHCVQDAGLDFRSESTTTSTRQPKLTLQKSQKAPVSAAKSKGIVRSTCIQSKPFIDESDSDSLDFDNPMALALNSPTTSSHSVTLRLGPPVGSILDPPVCNKVPPSSGGHLLSYLDKVELTGEGVGIGQRGITPPLALASGGELQTGLSTGFALDTGEKVAREWES